MGLWSASHAATIDVGRFRGHDQYLEQRADFPYRGVVDYLKVCGYWERGHQVHHEDGAFQCVTAEVDGKVVSRDLLDSMCEIAFLERHMKLDRVRVLDIGAGYGRFAHRLLEAYPDAFVFCTDSIGISRLVCEKYLAYRKIRRAMAIPPKAVTWMPPMDLAVNIHSWSECETDEVREWLKVLDVHKVPRLFIVPHDGGDLMTWGGPSYKPELIAHGWELAEEWTGPACQPKYYSLWERTCPTVTT
jgi:putative sugar O-methyltransferase